MRALDKTKNYSCLLSLIEEVQTLVNRMEGALSDIHDMEYLQKQRKDLKKELKELNAEIDVKNDLKKLIK